MPRAKPQKRLLKLIDVFSGAGGMTLGFSPSFGRSFQPIWANDSDAAAVETYNLNFGEHCTRGDIVELLKSRSFHIPQADVVIGGPPCQGFSLLNRNRSGDGRRQLWEQFLQVVQRSGASVFVMENVRQLLASEEFGAILAKARRLGFKVAYGTLCAADYGVPQLRYRAFLIGCRFYDPRQVFPPKPSHHKPGAPSDFQFDGTGQSGWRTVRDAIGDLPHPVGCQLRSEAPPLDWHFSRNFTPLSLQRYQAIPGPGMNRFDLQRAAPHLTPKCWIKKKSGGTDLFGRLWWDKPAPTIRTEFYKPEKGRFLHPEQHRPITHREAARLQSFPDDFRFVGPKLAVGKQIGNAVPPLLAAKVAEAVEIMFDRRDSL